MFRDVPVTELAANVIRELIPRTSLPAGEIEDELARRGGRYGLETMCIGGGQGIAAIFENLAPAGG